MTHVVNLHEISNRRGFANSRRVMHRARTRRLVKDEARTGT